MTPISKRLSVTVLLGISLWGFSARTFVGIVSGHPGLSPLDAPFRVYVLHGVGQFSRAVAIAAVTRMSATRFSLSLQAEHLPSPELLYTKFPRHAYVAWLVDGTVMHGPLRMYPVGLVFNRQSGTSWGRGSVSMSTVTSVVISAEPTAQAYMPILPMLTVLAGIHPYRMCVRQRCPTKSIDQIPG